MSKYSRFYNSYEGRYKSAKNKTYRILRNIMNRNCFSNNSYWYRFGYEIAGPVIYTFAKWIDEYINDNRNYSDVAFVARDGYYVKKVYDNYFKKDGTISTHYIYASRSIVFKCNAQYNEEYSKYLKNEEFKGKVAIVESLTKRFSAQRLISSNTNQDVVGLYWTIEAGAKNKSRGMEYSCFSNRGPYAIKSWTIMEMIMTAPEYPALSINNNEPVYLDKNQYEEERIKKSKDIEEGIMDFCEEIASHTELKCDPDGVTMWINSFLSNPNEEDLAEFDKILFADAVNHSDFVKCKIFDDTNKNIKYYFLNNKFILPYRGKVIEGKNKCLSRLLKSFDSKERLQKYLENYDVVSFDVFDTLVKRKTNKPSDVYKLLEQKNKLFDFASIREGVESRMRKETYKENGEIDIYDIYRKIADYYPNMNVMEAVSDELNTELEVVYPNHEMEKLFVELKKNNKRIIIITDMYLKKDMIEKILHKCGYDGYDSLYVSNEYQCNKQNGELQKIAEECTGKGLKYCHVGDSLITDYFGSKKAGWGAALWKG